MIGRRSDDERFLVFFQHMRTATAPLVFQIHILMCSFNPLLYCSSIDLCDLCDFLIGKADSVESDDGAALKFGEMRLRRRRGFRREEVRCWTMMRLLLLFNSRMKAFCIVLLAQMMSFA
jgi:hypothetical protein